MQKYKDELRVQKRKKILVRAVFCAVFIILGFMGVAYLLFFSRQLDVRSVKINAADELRVQISVAVEDWLNWKKWLVARRNNIVFLSSEQLASVLVGQFPKLESARVVKKLPHSLEISVNERKSAGIWCFSVRERCFYFDKNGIAFSPTQFSSGFLLLNVVDRRERDVELGDVVAEGDWLTNIIKAKENLNKHDINISEFVISADSFEEFHAVTAYGWTIMFSNSTDISKQIDALRIFLSEKFTSGQKANLQYIDLRIQDRIYYK